MSLLGHWAVARAGAALALPGNGVPTAVAALLLCICSSQPSITAPNRLPFGHAISGSPSEGFDKTVK